MKPFPTREEWESALAAGFVSDGCTLSPDTLLFSGFRLANEEPRAYPPLPCDLHDLRYWQGGNDIDRYWADVELGLGIFMLASAAGELHPDMKGTWEVQAREYLNRVRQWGGDYWDSIARRRRESAA